MTGLDTETHRGRVVLIATPREDLELWRYPVHQQWHVLIEWLRLHDTRYVCWNADYDIQAMLKFLGRFTNETILRRTSSNYGRYRVRFVPSKFFRMGIEHGKQNKTLFTIYDLMQFYACSLEKAARKLLGKGKAATGVEWSELLKTLRAGGARADQIRNYCRTDALRVEEIYNVSKASMEAAGVNFDKPVSCASIAVQKFSKSMAHDVPREINNAFEATYRGGRIECLMKGYFARAFLYDIHSAYPSVMFALAETRGSWLSVSKTPRPDALYAAVHCDLHIAREYRLPVPVKGETQLIYPYGQWRQWVDLKTYRVLESAGWVSKVRKGFQLIGDGLKRPFAALAEMYEERLRQPAQTWALKIIMNALYGKVAERIGKWFPSMLVNRDVEAWRGNFWVKREQWTKRTNFVYASAITAGIRLRMYNELPADAVIFYATDGVMTTRPIEGLDQGPGLGQWGEPEEVRDLVVVGSGVYTYKQLKCRNPECKATWTDTRDACPVCSTSAVVTKMRGFEVGLDLYTLLDKRRRILTLEVRRNWTLAQSIRQNKYDLFNELVDVPRYLDVCFDHKRIWEANRTGRDLLNRSYTSRPWAHYPDVTYREF